MFISRTNTIKVSLLYLKNLHIIQPIINMYKFHCLGFIFCIKMKF